MQGLQVALARAVGWKFIDLDEEYSKRRNIDDDIGRDGYAFYARTNVEVYLRITQGLDQTVCALSSGFMTYPPDIHPDIPEIHGKLLSSEATVLLLPAREIEACVQETVRRQMTRPHVLTSESDEESKIRARIPIYRSMRVRRVFTDVPVECVIEEVLAAVGLCA